MIRASDCEMVSAVRRSFIMVNGVDVCRQLLTFVHSKKYSQPLYIFKEFKETENCCHDTMKIQQNTHWLTLDPLPH